MKGELKLIREIGLDMYEAIIWFEDMPNLKLGKCEVKQSDKIQIKV